MWCRSIPCCCKVCSYIGIHFPDLKQISGSVVAINQILNPLFSFKALNILQPSLLLCSPHHQNSAPIKDILVLLKSSWILFSLPSLSKMSSQGRTAYCSEGSFTKLANCKRKGLLSQKDEGQSWPAGICNVGSRESRYFKPDAYTTHFSLAFWLKALIHLPFKVSFCNLCHILTCI